VGVPAQHVRRLIDQRDVALLLDDEIMFLKPQSVAEMPASTEFEGAEVAAAPAAPAAAVVEPLAALLDGLPVQNHVRLANRLLVDDPDNLEPMYPVVSREHGTAMASLIIHGDLNHGGAPISRPLYVRPVLRPSPGGERTPANRLLLDVIYQAVRRMKEGDGITPATAPSVVVVNLSLADDKRPFARMMSPLGRLLDFLAYKYRILFLVSAGNVLHRLPVPGFANIAEFEAATPEARETAMLHGLNAQKSQRTLFCPAEAMNILTIGAAHSGSGFTGAFPAGRFDPFTAEDLPNIVSAMGLGYKKAVKPELLFAGGRAPVHVVAAGQQLEVAPMTAGVALFGVKAARPRPASITYEDFTWGTSVATALATRAAHMISDAVLDSAHGSNHADVDLDYLPLVLKALLVHGARWGDKGELLETIFGPKGQGSHFPRRDDIARLLGYGVPDVQRVLDCTENRATLLGWGTILADQSLLYRIPLPAEIESNVALRNATVTLAWFSPINARHKGYRMAALDLSAGSDEKFWIVDERVPTQPTDKAVARGTVVHERRRGDKAKVFVEDGHMLLRISCRAGAGALTTPVPYALAVSFEVAATANIPVYERIRDRLRTPVQPQPPA
jgi:Subtilase family